MSMRFPRYSGTHQIQTRDLINALLTRQIFQMETTCRTMKKTFKISTTRGQCMGEVTVYIRVSCFGKKIITQFQIPQSGKSYLFKGIDDSTVFQCKKTTLTKEKIECACANDNKVYDGSGEAARICCPVVTTEECQQKKRAEDMYKPKCAPCCRAIRQDLFRRKEIVKKCGCLVLNSHARS